MLEAALKLAGESESDKQRISTLNHEAMTGRKKLEQLEQADRDRQKKGMDELTLAKTERSEFKTSYEKEKKRADGLEAELAFMKAGVADSETAMLYWERLTPDERAATTPAAYAKSRAAEKPSVFGPKQSEQSSSGFGGNHRQDEGGGQGSGNALINTDPQSQSDINKLMDDFDKMFK